MILLPSVAQVPCLLQLHQDTAVPSSSTPGEQGARDGQLEGSRSLGSAVLSHTLRELQGDQEQDTVPQGSLPAIFFLSF